MPFGFRWALTTHLPWSRWRMYVSGADPSCSSLALFSFLFLLNLPTTMSLSFPIWNQRGQRGKCLKTNLCVSNRPLRNSRRFSCLICTKTLIPYLSFQSAGWRLKCSRNRCCLHEIWRGLILIIDICFFMHPEKQGLPSIKELFKWPSTVHVFLQFCCGNMRTHTDISITYARLRVGPVDAITVCAILSHSESQRLPDRHT